MNPTPINDLVLEAVDNYPNMWKAHEDELLETTFVTYFMERVQDSKYQEAFDAVSLLPEFSTALVENCRGLTYGNHFLEDIRENEEEANIIRVLVGAFADVMTNLTVKAMKISI